MLYVLKLLANQADSEESMTQNSQKVTRMSHKDPILTPSKVNDNSTSDIISQIIN